MSLQDKNEICLTGRINKIFRYRNLTNIVITTGIISKPNNTVEYIRPSVIFLGEMKEEADKFKRGMQVNILAHVSSRMFYDENTKRNHYKQSLVGDYIVHPQSELEKEFGLASKKTAAPQNTASFAGKVYSLWRISDKTIKICISSATKIDGKKRINIAACEFHTPHTNEILEDIRKGDRVCAVGTIKSYTKKSDLKTYNRIALTDLQKI